MEPLVTTLVEVATDTIEPHAKRVQTEDEGIRSEGSKSKILGEYLRTEHESAWTSPEKNIVQRLFKEEVTEVVSECDN